MRAAAAIALVTGVRSIAASVSAQTSGTSWQQHSESPSSSHLVWGSVVLNNDDSCCEQVSEAPLEVSIDANVIAKLQDRAFRMGPVLWLRLVGDRSLRIIDPYPPKYDNFDYQRWRWHLLEAWWDEQRYYVVDVGRHEDRHAYLISEIDGEVSIVFAAPVLSPSGRNAVAFDSSVISGQSLEFIDLTSRPPKMLEITFSSSVPRSQGVPRSPHSRLAR